MILFDKSTGTIVQVDEYIAYTVYNVYIVEIYHYYNTNFVRIFFQPLRPKTTSTAELAAAAPQTT